MNTKQMFNTIFSQSNIPEITFNVNWNNGTGYFDNAVASYDAPKLGLGEMGKATDNHGRHLLIVNTPVGNVVLFERFNDPLNSVIVSNAPAQIERLFPELSIGKMTCECIAKMCGVMYAEDRIIAFGMPNIGMLLNDIVQTAVEDNF